jgi:hypothetical protein
VPAAVGRRLFWGINSIGEEMDSESTLSVLPNELIVNILSCLDHVSLCKARFFLLHLINASEFISSKVSRVCKAFHDFSNLDSLWRELYRKKWHTVSIIEFTMTPRPWKTRFVERLAFTAKHWEKDEPKDQVIGIDMHAISSGFTIIRFSTTTCVSPTVSVKRSVTLRYSLFFAAPLN